MAKIVYDAFYLEAQTFGMTRSSLNLLRATAELMRLERPADEFSLVNFSGTFLPGFEVPGVEVQRLGISTRMGLYGAVYLPFLSPIRHVRGRPDAVFWNNLFFFGKDVPGVRQVVYVHDLRCLRFPDTAFPKELWLVHAGLRRLLKSDCPVVVPSEWTKKDVIELGKVAAHRLHVVPHGVEGAFHVIADGNRLEDLAQRLDLKGRRFIFYIGAFKKHKNLAFLFRAFREVRRRCGQDLLLVLAGETTKQLAPLLDEAGYDEADRAGIRHLGFVADKDLVGIYNLATCLAFPSLNEGFGLPLLEAMACGCPVISSNKTCLPEVLGDAGVLLDPADMEGWIEAICAVIENSSLRDDLRRRGPERAKDMTWKKTAERLLALVV